MTKVSRKEGDSDGMQCFLSWWKDRGGLDGDGTSLGSRTCRGCDFPQKGKAIQMLVGFAAGGSTDVGARLLASGMEKELGTSVMVVNKPGASGQIAYTALTQAKPDGYTIGNTNSPLPSSAIWIRPARPPTPGRVLISGLACP